MSHEAQQIDRSKVIGKKQLRELTNLSYQTWWRMEREHLAVARIRLSAGRVGWNLGAVLDWLSSRETIELTKEPTSMLLTTETTSATPARQAPGKRKGEMITAVKQS